MSLIFRYKYHLAATCTMIGILLIGTQTRIQTEAPEELPQIESRHQLEHALELLTTREAALPLAVEDSHDMRGYILKRVRTSLPAAHRRHAFAISRTLIETANRHNLDPLFLMAVIQTESGFNPLSRGDAGEIGLMQILPSTAKWLAPRVGLDPEKVNLEDPHQNIRLGAVFFAQLRRGFEGHPTRYVAAYNMGAKNVRRLLKKKIEPKIYPTKVLSNYKNYYVDIALVQHEVATQNLASAK